VLAVTVDGQGDVSGAGISCRDGTGDCVELYAEGTSVTLTADTDPGATFSGWSGDCSAATGTTCTLAMDSAKAVTAMFTADGGSIGTGGDPTLTVSPTGNGTVTGSGIDCGNGALDCSEIYAPGTSVTLTATPASGAVFSRWGGACSGSTTACSLAVNASQSVTAAFSASVATEPAEEPASASFSAPKSNAGATRTFAIRSLGRPIVVRRSRGWAVTLHFHTSRAASALVALSRNGRRVGAFTFSSRAGNVLVGPFNVAGAGAYVFRLTLGDGRGSTASLVWNLCISPCGRGSSTPTR